MKTSAFALNLCKGAFAMKLRILIISIILPFLGQGQNLVPNPSFENFIECPDTSILGFNTTSDWYQWNSADYFNTCDTTPYNGVPMNFIGGYQWPTDGNAYAGLKVFNPLLFSREYIEVELDSTLLSGETYYVRFYLNLADSFKYGITNVGAMFTDTLFDPFPPPSWNWQTGSPQFENLSTNMLTDKNNWMKVSGSFIASGGEKFLTIGNFSEDSVTNSQLSITPSPGTQNGTYYFIDEVYVGRTPPPVGVSDFNGTIECNVYPNPSDGIFNITFDSSFNEAVVAIYDLMGRIVFEQSIKESEVQIDLSDRSKGIYLLKVNSQQKIGVKRLILQ
jgi:hypothetical protein